MPQTSINGEIQERWLNGLPTSNTRADADLSNSTSLNFTHPLAVSSIQMPSTLPSNTLTLMKIPAVSVQPWIWGNNMFVWQCRSLWACGIIPSGQNKERMCKIRTRLVQRWWTWNYQKPVWATNWKAQKKAVSNSCDQVVWSENHYWLQPPASRLSWCNL